jgi:pyrimidine oxygenase
MRLLELGLFLPVGTRGFIISTCPTPIAPTYAHNKEITLLAERMELDFVMSMAKWRGFGGPSGFWDSSLESITASAALAECTSRIRIYPTAHSLAFHPAILAKMVATLDHISGGRAGLNIVAGAISPEFTQMGLWLPKHGSRYEVMSEWLQIMKRLWTEDRVTYEGKYFQLKDCASDPKPIQKPYPLVINAALSPVGREFVAREGDANFFAQFKIEDCKRHSLEVKRLARSLGRELKTYLCAILFLGEDDRAAEKLYRYHVDHVDSEAVGTMMEAMFPSVPEEMVAKDQSVQGFMRTTESLEDKMFFGTPLCGGPERMAALLKELAEEGEVDGFMMIFPDYLQDLRFFGKRVLPILHSEGLRDRPPAWLGS